MHVSLHTFNLDMWGDSDLQIRTFYCFVRRYAPLTLDPEVQYHSTPLLPPPLGTSSIPWTHSTTPQILRDQVEISCLGTFQILVGKCDNSGSFGELALMYNMPRAATVQAATEADGGNGMLWAMDRCAHKLILSQ